MSSSINPAPFHKVEVLSTNISIDLMMAIVEYCNTLLTNLAKNELPYRYGANMSPTFENIDELTAILIAVEEGFVGFTTRFTISASNLAVILKILILKEDRNMQAIRECINLIKSCK